MSFLARTLAIVVALLLVSGGVQANPRVAKLKKKQPIHKVDTLKGASRLKIARHFRSWKLLANYYSKSKTTNKPATNKPATNLTVPRRASDGKKRLRELKANLPATAPRGPHR
jgi:hypothetical protein